MLEYTSIDTHTLTILYVEDEKYIMEHTSVLFKRFFKQVYTALDGEKGLEIYEKNKDDIDLIITDIKMPKLDGITMSEYIRTINPQIPILITTAYSDEDYFIKSIDLGVSSYIIKPFNFAHLILKVKEAYYPIEQDKKLKRFNEELQQEVKQRTEDLEQLNKTLEDKVKDEVEKNRQKQRQLFEQAKMVSMGEMIGNIAHQWRQPLSGISAVLTNIKSKIQSKQYEYKELCDIIEQKHIKISDYIEYLSNTIDTFSNFIKEKKESKDIVVQDRINIVLNLVDATLEHYNIKLIKNISKTPIVLNLISGELDQVLMNIINNAKDILIEREIKDRWIKISLKEDDNEVILSIEDNAGGIKEDILPYIFDPYFTTKHKSQGTGLGLHMSREIIVNSLKGKIYATNTKYGAKFTIVLFSKN